MRVGPLAGPDVLGWKTPPTMTAATCKYFRTGTNGRMDDKAGVHDRSATGRVANSLSMIISINQSSLARRFTGQRYGLSGIFGGPFSQ